MSNHFAIRGRVPGGYVAPSRLSPEYIRSFLPSDVNEDGAIDPIMAREALGPVVAPQTAPPVAIPLSPSNMGRMGTYGDILQNQQKAAEDYYAQQNSVYQRMADEQQKAMADAERQQAEREARQEENRQKMEDYQNEYGDLARRIGDAEAIDPGRLMEGWRGIMAAVSVGLGAMASSFTGQPNAALDIINKAIDRDIDAQRFNAQSAAAASDKKANMQANAYTMAKETYKTDDAAFDALKIYKKEQLLEKLSALETRMKPSETLFKLKNMQTDLAMDVQKQKQDLIDRNEARRAQWAQIAENKRSNLANEQIAMGKIGADLTKMENEYANRTIEGLGTARDAPSFNEALKQKFSLDKAYEAVQEAKVLREQYHKNLVSPKRFQIQRQGELSRAKLSAALNNIILNVGVMNVGDRQFIEQILSSPTSLDLLDSNKKFLDSLEKTILDTGNIVSKTYTNGGRYTPPNSSAQDTDIPQGAVRR